MKRMPHDTLSQWFTRIAYKLHPRLGTLYEQHYQFFNDGFVELVCLIIAYAFTWGFSLYVIGLELILLLLVVATPITFGLKYFLHKLWVWAK